MKFNTTSLKALDIVAGVDTSEPTPAPTPIATDVFNEVNVEPFLKPDKTLADLESKLRTEGSDKAAIQLKIEKRQTELAQKYGSVSFGAGGYMLPGYSYSEASGAQYGDLLAKQTAIQNALANKMQLIPTASYYTDPVTGKTTTLNPIYQAQYYGPQGQTGWMKDPITGEIYDPMDPVRMEKTMRDSIAGTTDPRKLRKTFYNADGTELTPEQVAKTAQGVGWAKAGMDIGFGPGMLPGGVNAREIFRQQGNDGLRDIFVNNLVLSGEMPVEGYDPKTGTITQNSSGVPPTGTRTTSTGNLTSSPLGNNFSGSGTTADPFRVNGTAYTGAMFGSNYNNGIVVDTAAKTADDIAKQGRLDARTEFSNTLKALGLPQNLIDELDNMIKQDYTKSQMYLELQKTPAWKLRFPGMDALSAAGKAVDAGQYISMEKGFLQTLDYYGLDKAIFGTTAELGKQIGRLVSPKAFEDRVALAAQDVEANPDVLAQLNTYFGVDKSTAITYLLNPEIGIDIIKRQARAAEIGAKAAKSAFDFGQTKEGRGVAESFINAAGTMDLQALDVAFQQARGLSDIQSSIAATEGADYNDLQAVSAILGKDQAAILDSQRRAARSVARFSGGAGLGSGSLKRESTI